MFTQEDFDTAVRPQDDFNQYTNGGWAKQNPIPETESRWGSFLMLAHQNFERAHDILQQLIKEPELAEEGVKAKLQKYAIAAGDSISAEQTGLAAFKEWHTKIMSVNSTPELWELICELQTFGISTPYCLYTDFDEKDSSKYVLRYAQDGLGLPERDYYFKDDLEIQKIRDLYPKHIVHMLGLVGIGEGERIAQNVWAVELQLATVSMTATERRDIEKLYNKVSIEEQESKYPFLCVSSFCKTLGVSVPETVFIDQLQFFGGLNEMWHSVPLAEWKDYVTWHVARQLFTYMGERIEKENFTFFGTAVSGAPEMQPRWKRVVRWVTADLGDALGQLFVEKYFPPLAKERMQVMVQDLKDAFAVRIQKISWMSDETKHIAQQKLERITIKIGYPDRWVDYTDLLVESGSFIQNGMNANRFELRRKFKKLSGPIDRTEWFMAPHIVNAYAQYNLMEVVFPAGILLPPFFDFSSDDAENYGAIGSVIGHELTHHFDNRGGQYDINGNLHNWWNDEDKTKFQERAAVLREQANKVEILPGLMLNGELTLGENIADLGGLEIAMDALERSMVRAPLGPVDNMTPSQRFFLSYTRSERTVARDGYIRNLVLSDPHAPSVFRVNGILRNMDRFCEAFGVTEKDALYLPPAERVKIW